MVKKKYNYNYKYLYLFIIIILIISYLCYSFFKLNKKYKLEKESNIDINNNYKNEIEKNNNLNFELNNTRKYEKNKNIEINNIKNKYNLLTTEFENLTSTNKNFENKVCLSIDEYNNILNKKTKNDTINRDYRVLKDDLFPPINRSDTYTHTELANNIINRNMYIKTNDMGDTFRLVGYITNTSNEKDTGNNSWKLFGRQKDRHMSEFYITPTNNNNDVKIYINDDIVVGDKLRDIYTIPNYITFNSPMLNNNPYHVVEVPKQDLTRTNDYL